MLGSILTIDGASEYFYTFSWCWYEYLTVNDVMRFAADKSLLLFAGKRWDAVPLLGVYALYVVPASHRSVCRIQHHYEWHTRCCIFRRSSVDAMVHWRHSHRRGAVAGASGACTYEGGLRQKYVFEVAYDGTDFCGFQLQPSVPTVQAALERSLCRFLQGMHRDHLLVQGAARTDSGVHARQQYVEFYSNRVLNEETFVRAMNSMLPSSIVISALSPVEDDFNVRFTNGKIYTYDIHLDKYRDPFTCRYRHVPKNPAGLDIDAMREACQSFVGLRDFRLLTNKTDRALESSERLIYQCKLGDIPGGIRVAVMGKGFLYKQVRNMVGVLIAVGYHKLDRHDIDILLQGDETKLYNQKSQYQVAEGKGLCLQRVFLLDEQLPDSVFAV